MNQWQILANSSWIGRRYFRGAVGMGKIQYGRLFRVNRFLWPALCYVPFAIWTAAFVLGLPTMYFVGGSSALSAVTHGRVSAVGAMLTIVGVYIVVLSCIDLGMHYVSIMCTRRQSDEEFVSQVASESQLHGVRPEAVPAWFLLAVRRALANTYGVPIECIRADDTARSLSRYSLLSVPLLPEFIFEINSETQMELEPEELARRIATDAAFPAGDVFELSQMLWRVSQLGPVAPCANGMHADQSSLLK